MPLANTQLTINSLTTEKYLWRIKHRDGYYIASVGPSAGADPTELHTSADGVTWTRTPVADIDPTYGFIYDAWRVNGTWFVYTRDAAWNNWRLRYSSDLVTWATANITAGKEFYDVSYFAGHWLVATADNGSYFRASDLSAWSSFATGVSIVITKFAVAAGELFCMSHNSGTTPRGVSRSADGTTFVLQPLTVSSGFFEIRSGGDSAFVLTGSDTASKYLGADTWSTPAALPAFKSSSVLVVQDSRLITTKRTPQPVVRHVSLDANTWIEVGSETLSAPAGYATFFNGPTDGNENLLWAFHSTSENTEPPYILRIDPYAAPVITEDDLEDAFSLDDERQIDSEFYAQTIVELSDGTDQLWPHQNSEEIEDAVSLSDASEYETSNLIEDSVSLSDARAEQREQFLADTIRLSDALTQAAAMSLEDSVDIDDATHVQIQQVISDTILLSDLREQVSAGSAELQDTFSLTDALRQGGTYEVEVTVEFSDAHAQAGSLLLEDTVTFDDALNQEGIVDGGNLTDTFVLSDELQLVVASNIEIEDGITLSDDVFYKNPGAIAWVMNTETAAPSWYSNWQFVDMVQIGNRVLAVGPEGLVELGADTDAGETIDASINYGFMDYGTDQKKRVDSFWFGYSSDDVLEVSVETLGNTVYTYSMEARNAEQARNNRIRPGKGLNARYWRVGINNVGGCDFDVDSLGADVVPTSRRL